MAYTTPAHLPLIGATQVGPAVLLPGAGASTGVGNVFYVCSANAAATSSGGPGLGLTPQSPFNSINNALTHCLSNNGDVVFVLPGHVETVNSAGALTIANGTCDGVSIIFSGNGADRGLINFVTSTAAQITWSANNVMMYCPRITGNIDALVAGISITGSDNTIINGEWIDSTSVSSLIQIITTNAAKRLTISGWTYYEPGTVGSQKTEAIRIVGGDHHRITDLNIHGNFSTANFNNVTTATSQFMAARWNLANTATTAAATNLQKYVSTSTFLAPDVAPAGLTAGNEYCISKTIALPQSTTATVFTVVGGPIQILQITGLITTVIGSVSCPTKLTYTPTTGGTSTDLCATVDLNAAAAGDTIILQTSFATAATLSTNAVESIAQIVQEKLVYPLLVPPGALIVNSTGSDGGTGRVQWCMRYKPCSPGVSVI